MKNRYPTLLSPIRIGNVVLKNRLHYPNASPHFLQGPETYPADGLRAYYANIAKSGAAIVTLAEWINPGVRSMPQEDAKRMQSFDLSDPSGDNYFCKLADEIHFYGSKVTVEARIEFPAGYSIGGAPMAHGPMEFVGGQPKAIPADQIPSVINNFINKVERFKSFGFDGVSIRFDDYMEEYYYGERTDQYSGMPLENRFRFLLEVYSAIKTRLGKDFLTLAVFKGDRYIGHTLDETIAFAKMAEGVIDIMQFRDCDTARGAVCGFSAKEHEHYSLRYTEAVKKAGANVITQAIGGFQDLEEAEAALAAGQTDMIVMARGLIADPELMEKAADDRGEDVVPCIRCSKCHGTLHAPWLSFCSVNPTMGIEDKLNRMMTTPGPMKKVAIIGGGPAGMRAAIYVSDRGHDVTIYEKTDQLGGQINHAEFTEIKWPLKNYRNWLIQQVQKRHITVMLNHAPTPAELETAAYDVIIAALGAEANIPPISGLTNADGTLKPEYYTVLSAYGNVENFGQRVAVIGASEAGVEAAVYVAESGRSVTLLTRQDCLAHDAPKIHGITECYTSKKSQAVDLIGPIWDKYDNMTGILNATTTAVDGGTITYQQDGTEKQIEVDTVIICGGMTARMDEALSYAQAASRFYMIGDCGGVGNIQKCSREAFAVSNRF